MESVARLNLDDIYVSEKIYFYHRRIPIAGYTEYGLGGYPSANFDSITNKLNFKKGFVCSGDSFDINETDKEIILKNHCSARDMEAAGVAWISMLTNTPILAIKGITDIVGSKDGPSDFKNNFRKVTNNLSIHLQQLLKELNDR